MLPLRVAVRLSVESCSYEASALPPSLHGWIALSFVILKLDLFWRGFKTTIQDCYPLIQEWGKIREKCGKLKNYFVKQSVWQSANKFYNWPKSMLPKFLNWFKTVETQSKHCYKSVHSFRVTCYWLVSTTLNISMTKMTVIF